MFPVIWNNWYGRKQERSLCFNLNNYQRKLDGDVRATHNYADVERVEWSEAGQLVVHLKSGVQEHYHSTHKIKEIVAAFQRHCHVQQLPAPKAAST